MPVVTDETVWQLLHGDRFTTPILREWMPWLRQEMRNRGHIVPLNQSGCQAGLALAKHETLDELVSEGLRKKHLAIGGHDAGRVDHNGRCRHAEIKNLEEYMLTYGPLLGQHAERSLKPLHVPGQHPLTTVELLRQPFEAQSHVIEATRKALRRQKSILLVGEMGTGKTIMGMASVHAHAAGRPYRALVFCPGQLVNKWEREIRETIPGAEVIQIESWKTLLPLKRTEKPAGVEWYIIARDRAKLGAKWRPCFQQRTHLVDGFLRCPQCGRRLVNDKREPLLAGTPGKDGQPGTGLWRKRSKCEWVLSSHETGPDSDDAQANRLVDGCGSPLWQMSGELRRYEPALFIKRRLRNYFKYLLVDEIHEEKGANTAQGHAAAALVSACRKVIALTGTLIGGYAEHLRPLLFRLSPGSLVQEGLGWHDALAFNERYGRIETRITERSGGRRDSDNRMSRGSKATIKTPRPGIMPPLFGRHLIDKCVFLGLNEVASNLPPLSEECIAGTDGPGTGNSLPARRGGTARRSDQGDDEAAGPEAVGRLPADTARLPRLSVWMGADRLLEGRPIRDGRRAAESRPRRSPQGTGTNRPGAVGKGSGAKGLGVRPVHGQARRSGPARTIAPGGGPSRRRLACQRPSCPDAKTGSPSTPANST